MEPTPQPITPAPVVAQPIAVPAPIAAASVAPAQAAPQAYASMEHSRKPLVLTVVAVLVLLAVAGGALYYVKLHSQAAPAPTPTPAVATGDVRQSLPNIDSSLKEADVNIATVTAGLKDIQGDLSE